MNITTVDALAILGREHNLRLAEYQRGEHWVRLRFSAPCVEPAMVGAAPAQVVGKPALLNPLRAPGMGIVRLAHPQRSEPEVAVGQRVAAGSIVAWLQQGFLLRPLTTAVEAVIAEIAVSEGAVVGFDQPVMHLTPC